MCSYQPFNSNVKYVFTNGSTQVYVKLMTPVAAQTFSPTVKLEQTW